MGRITFTADSHHEDVISDVEAEDGVESQSAAVRECISRYAELQQRVDELQQELDQRDARVDDLRRQLQAANAKDERVQELATYVEEERRVEQQWRQAGLGTRLKWRLFGMPDNAETA